MHSDEMNKIEVRNVEMKFSFRWETAVFLFVVQFE